MAFLAGWAAAADGFAVLVETVDGEADDAGDPLGRFEALGAAVRDGDVDEAAVLGVDGVGPELDDDPQAVSPSIALVVAAAKT